MNISFLQLIGFLLAGIFWVISKFSDIDIKTMLRVHSIASVLMGIVTMIFVWLLSFIIL